MSWNDFILPVGCERAVELKAADSRLCGAPAGEAEEEEGWGPAHPHNPLSPAKKSSRGWKTTRDAVALGPAGGPSFPQPAAPGRLCLVPENMVGAAS